MGRPKHPDILTPREWEVLALLREGRSNEEIAEVLGVTLATARFHVSEILSKLGVANRREAATWQPEPERRRWAWAFAPLVLLQKPKLSTVGAAAGILVMAAALVLIALLAWGASRTSSALLASGDPVCGTPLPLTSTPVDLTAVRRTAASANATWQALTEQEKRDTALTPGAAVQTSEARWVARFNALHCDLRALPVHRSDLGGGPPTDPIGAADLIVRGRVESRVFEPSNLFRRMTRSTVRVLEVYKASVAVGSTITVRQPGGPLSYNGGTIIGEFVEQDLLLGGEDVLLLLVPNGDGTFVPESDTGIYFIRDGRVYAESGYPPPDAPFRGSFPAHITGSTLQETLALLKIVPPTTPTH